MTLSVEGVTYSEISTGPAELLGILRYTDEHHFAHKIKKSVFKVVYVEKGKEKEVVPVEVSFDNRIKSAMVTIIDAVGEK